MGGDKRDLFHNCRGSTAIEYALVAPVLLVMVVSIMEGSQALAKGNTTKWAIEKAARDAVLSPATTEADLQRRVDELLVGIDSDLEVEVSYTIDTSRPVPLGQLAGTYEHVIDIPLLGSKTLSFSTKIAVPQPPPAPS